MKAVSEIRVRADKYIDLEEKLQKQNDYCVFIDIKEKSSESTDNGTFHTIELIVESVAPMGSRELEKVGESVKRYLEGNKEYSIGCTYKKKTLAVEAPVDVVSEPEPELIEEPIETPKSKVKKK